MTQIITITAHPPQVKQFYDSTLLSKPTSKFYDESELLWRVYTYIKLKLSKKSKYHPNSEIKYNQLEREFLELYERAKTKEKDATRAKNSSITLLSLIAATQEYLKDFDQDHIMYPPRAGKVMRFKRKSDVR